MDGTFIEWWHGDQAKSVQAARGMVAGFGIGGLKNPPVLESKETRGLAVEMAITWSGKLTVVDGGGKRRTYRGGPRNSTNRALIRIGKSFGSSTIWGLGRASIAGRPPVGNPVGGGRSDPGRSKAARWPDFVSLRGPK